MTIKIVLLVVTLMGMFNPTSKDIEHAENLCARFGGVQEMSVTPRIQHTSCHNGLTFISLR